jgi:hypothetical protein
MMVLWDEMKAIGGIISQLELEVICQQEAKTLV